MRALENRAIFSGFRHDREKRIEQHHERVKTVKKVVDTSAPQSLQTRSSSPSKRLMSKQGNDCNFKYILLLLLMLFTIIFKNSTKGTNYQR